MAWILDHIQWVFSGIGVFALTLFLHWRSKKQDFKETTHNINFKISHETPGAEEGGKRKTSSPEGKLGPLVVQLTDGNHYQIQVLFSYRVSDPIALIKHAGNMESAEKMLFNSLRVLLIQELEQLSPDEIRNNRGKIGEMLKLKMENKILNSGLTMEELEIGSISQKPQKPNVPRGL